VRSYLIKEERDNWGRACCDRLWEAEGAEERGRIEKGRKKRKNSKNVELRNEE
jgi:hypothetical protein